MYDGDGTAHDVFFRISDGCADANTGFFATAHTTEGMWVMLRGAEAGDCGTLVRSTALGRARYAPHQRELTGLLPANTTWADNAYETGHHVELFVFAICMVLHQRSANQCVA